MRRFLPGGCFPLLFSLSCIKKGGAPCGAPREKEEREKNVYKSSMEDGLWESRIVKQVSLKEWL